MGKSKRALGLLVLPLAFTAGSGSGASAHAGTGGSPVQAAQAPARDSLRQAAQRVSEAARSIGVAAALGTALAPDAVLLLEGAPIIRGREQARALLAAQPVLHDVRGSWEPFRVLVARDGRLGVTFGGTVRQPGGGPARTGRFITVWTRNPPGSWEIAAHLETGLLPEGAVLPERASPDPAPLTSGAFAAADLAFAKLAADSGAPLAFTRYVAPDGMTFAGTGELNIGPAAVGGRLAEGRAGTARWAWHPVAAFASGLGDLGATIGEADIQLTDREPRDAFYSKYLTVWQRQADGSLKFIVDGGSSRPH